MKFPKLSVAAVLVSSLLGGAIANAEPFHPAEPVYGASHVAVPIATNYGGGRYENWKRFEIARFQEAEQRRTQEENARLANERANFVSRWGWNAQRMYGFDRQQANERGRFEQAEANRRNAFYEQLARQDRPMPAPVYG